MEIISQAGNGKLLKDFENINQSPKEVGWFWGKVGVLILLVLSLIVDILGIISGVIDLGTAGIVGWILRILSSLIYLLYLGWFWIESNKFDYTNGRKFALKSVQKIKSYTKNILNSLRIILGVSLFTKWIPIIGAIIDALPIETLAVIFLFIIWPRLINYLAESNEG
ncbi:MAG: hypothetical protein NZ866_00770 [Patescibacteria group bacterium]|nr:hypothetical protein [Patescibacteria group bacterium]